MTDTRAADDQRYRVVDDPDRLDMDVVHRALSEGSYWARGRPRDIIEAAHRGNGLGVSLVRALAEAPDLAAVGRWMLATDDAHGLYERFGFGRVEPATLMQRDRPQPADR